MKNRKRAFTLVELLVVIGIIALLISILLPSLNRARAMARATVCQSNLRQMYLAIVLYQNDYKQYIPRPLWADPLTGWDDPACWVNAVPTAIRQKPFGASAYAPANPQDSRRSMFVCPVGGAFHDQSITYAYNLQLTARSVVIPVPTINPDAPIKPSMLKGRQFDPLPYNPGLDTLPLIMDGAWYPTAACYLPYRSRDFGGSPAGPNEFNMLPPSQPHLKGTNVLFLDGHVAAVSEKDTLWTASRPRLTGGNTPW